MSDELLPELDGELELGDVLLLPLELELGVLGVALEELEELGLVEEPELGVDEELELDGELGVEADPDIEDEPDEDGLDGEVLEEDEPVDDLSAERDAPVLAVRSQP